MPLMKLAEIKSQHSLLKKLPCIYLPTEFHYAHLSLFKLVWQLNRAVASHLNNDSPRFAGAMKSHVSRRLTQGTPEKSI